VFSCGKDARTKIHVDTILISVLILWQIHFCTTRQKRVEFGTSLMGIGKSISKGTVGVDGD
jgi:hypothetical protein